MWKKDNLGVVLAFTDIPYCKIAISFGDMRAWVDFN